MTKKKIVNVVATADLKQEISLTELRAFKHIFYDSDVYGGRVAYYKSPDLQGKVSIFSSGKMISVGTTSKEKAISDLHKVKNFLVKKKMVKPRAMHPEIRNIVAVADLEKNVDIEELSQSHKMIYEPEQFPAGILKINEPYRATILLYSTGKAVITGLKNTKHIEPVIQYLESFVFSGEREDIS